MEKSYTKLQIVFKDVLNVSNFQRSFKYSALFVMQVSFPASGDLTERTRQRNVSFGHLKFAEWRSVLKFFT